MRHYYGVQKLDIENSSYGLDIFLYDTLDTIYQNKPPAIFEDGVPPLSVIDHHLFTSLRGVFLAGPGSKLHTKTNNAISLYTYVVMVDRYFFTSLTNHEFDALIEREEVLYRHLVKTDGSLETHPSRDYYITHDTLTCVHGVKARHLRSALIKSKRFEYQAVTKFFKLDRFDQMALRLLYAFQRFNRHNRLRMKNLRMLEKKPPMHIVNDRLMLHGARKKA